nr:MAG TPA: hypothetical protein [Caudoviricetes sp.]
MFIIFVQLIILSELSAVLLYIIYCSCLRIFLLLSLCCIILLPYCLLFIYYHRLLSFNSQ